MQSAQFILASIALSLPVLPHLWSGLNGLESTAVLDQRSGNEVWPRQVDISEFFELSHRDLVSVARGLLEFPDLGLEQLVFFVKEARLPKPTFDFALGFPHRLLQVKSVVFSFSSCRLHPALQPLNLLLQADQFCVLLAFINLAL